MYKEQPKQQKLFRQVLKGEQSALMDLLEGERRELFDYLMRMTGQVSRSLESTDEVFASLTRETIATLSSHAEFKVCVYATARRFNADIWNADTSMLVNAALEPKSPRSMDVIDTDVKDPKAAAQLDKAFRGLGSELREVLLLSAVIGFELPEISEIMDRPVRDVEQRISQALVLLKQELGQVDDVVKFLREHLVAHPQPVRSSQMTLNLSMVMQGIKTKPVGLWSPLRLALAGILVAAVVVWLVYPAAFDRLAEVVRGTVAATNQ